MYEDAANCTDELIAAIIKKLNDTVAPRNYDTTSGYITMLPGIVSPGDTQR